jgi:SPP1 family phage portal protein
MEIVDVAPNPLGEVPIIEYQYNSVYMSCFESIIPLLDAIDQVQSDRLDGLDQAIQSLLVFYNCELGEDEKGDPITPSYVRAAGALFLKSIGENKADLKEIVSNLDQSQTQVLINNLYEMAMSICGMPSVSNSFPGDSTGLAIELKDGWTICEMNARNTEDLFKESNRQFDRIIVNILKVKGLLDISLNDFELHFTRNELRAVQSKAQALQTLLAAGLHPTLALAKSGISADPVSDYEISKGYMTLRWGDPNAPKVEAKMEEEIPSETIEEGEQGSMGNGAI